jgi:hypothetical protein
VAQDSRGEVMKTRQPAGHTVGTAELVAKRGGPALSGEQLQQGSADPQDGPHGGEPSGDRGLSGIGWSAMTGCRPSRERKDRLRHRGTGGTGDH